MPGDMDCGTSVPWDEFQPNEEKMHEIRLLKERTVYRGRRSDQRPKNKARSMHKAADAVVEGEGVLCTGQLCGHYGPNVKSACPHPQKWQQYKRAFHDAK